MINHHNDGPTGWDLDPYVQQDEGMDQPQADHHAFCQGMPMTMYMEGFQWALFGQRRQEQQYDGNEVVVEESFAFSSQQEQQQQQQQYSEGFPPFIAKQQQPPPCLVYLVPTWMLEDRGSFEGAVMFSFLLALLMEVLSSLRGIIVGRQDHQPQHIQMMNPPQDDDHTQSRNHSSSSSSIDRNRSTMALTMADRDGDESTSQPRHQQQQEDGNANQHPQQQQRRRHMPWVQHALLNFIYAIQAILGYLLMFMAMSFSSEIILATVSGLMIGNLLFFRYQDFQSPTKRRRRQQQQQQQQQQLPSIPASNSQQQEHDETEEQPTTRSNDSDNQSGQLWPTTTSSSTAVATTNLSHCLRYNNVEVCQAGQNDASSSLTVPLLTENDDDDDNNARI